MSRNLTEGFQGISFGIMDGLITTLGVLTGLGIATDQTITALGIIITGLGNSFANAAGIHVSQETETHHGRREVMKATIFGFISTFAVSVILVIPLYLLSLHYAIYVDFFLAMMILIFLGAFVAKVGKRSYSIIIEYMAFAFIVLIISYLLGTAYKTYVFL